MVVVEDDADIALMTAHVLRADKHQVVEFLRGKDAIEYTGWDDTDVALVDLMMPDISGLDVIRFLNSFHPHVHRIVHTASLTLLRSGLEENESDLAEVTLIKPYNIELLRVAVQERGSGGG